MSDPLDPDFLRRLQGFLGDGGYLDESVEARSGTRYKPLRLIGEGVTKSCWEADDLMCRRRVALLVCRHQDKASETRFLEEMRLYARMPQESIATLLDAGRDEQGRLFFVSQLLEGESLRERLHRPLTTSEALTLATRLIDLMAQSHRAGICHLDLKPEHVRIDEFGGLKVTDWEMAEEPDSIPLAGLVRGTPGYCPSVKVQREGGCTPQQADLHAIGRIIFEVLGAAGEDAVRRLDPGLRAILTSCLKAGYADAAGLRHDWQAWMNGQAPLVERAGFWRQLRLLARRHRGLALRLAVLLALGLALGFTWIQAEHRHGKRLEKALDGEKNEQRRRLALLQDVHPVLINELERLYLKGDIPAAEQHLKLLHPLSNTIDAWPLWSARLQLRRGVGSIEGKRLLLKSGNAKDRLMAAYAERRSEPIWRARLEGELKELPDRWGLQCLLSILASSDAAGQADALHLLEKLFPGHLRERLLFLRDSSPSDSVSHQLWRQAEAAARLPIEAGRRLDCHLAIAIAQNLGRRDMAELFESLVPANLALGCHAWSDGADERQPSLAVDGNLDRDNYWAASGFPCTLSIDLGDKLEFRSIDLSLYCDKPGARRYAYRLSVSDTPWGPRLVLAESAPRPSQHQPFHHEFPPVNARYIHVAMLSNNVNQAVHVREVEVFKAAAGGGLRKLQGSTGGLNSLNPSPSIKGVNEAPQAPIRR